MAQLNVLWRAFFMDSAFWLSQESVVNKDFNVNYDQWEEHVVSELDGAIYEGLQRWGKWCVADKHGINIEQRGETNVLNCY